MHGVRREIGSERLRGRAGEHEWDKQGGRIANTIYHWLLVALQDGMGVGTPKTETVDAGSFWLVLGHLWPRSGGLKNLKVLVEWRHRGAEIVK